MDYLRPSADTVLSPWAERYPVYGTRYRVGNTVHSSFRPEYPNIDDAKYHDQDPDPVINVHPYIHADIDRLLFGEDLQGSELWGCATWQTVIFNRYVRFSPQTGFISGGHRPPAEANLPSFRIPARLSSLGGRRTLPQIAAENAERDYTVYRNERIKVDETQWLEFLRKERWFDWTEVTPDFTQGPYSGQEPRVWSVDDPELWDVLSISLELLRTILYGRWEYWNQFVDIFGRPPFRNASVLLDYATEVMIARKRNYSIGLWGQSVLKTAKESCDRLISLLSRITWTFLDSEGAHAVTISPPVADDGTQPYTSMIAISIGKIDAMTHPDLTLSELCTLQVDLAITIVHELMHAIMVARFSEDNHVGNLMARRRTGPVPGEPFLNGDGIAEAGHYMEQIFFGGVFELNPSHQLPSMRYPPPLVQVLKRWPWPSYTARPSAPNSDHLKPDFRQVINQVCSTWTSKMLSEAFWKDRRYPAKSENFFHRNSIFVLKNPAPRPHNERRITGTAEIADLDSLTYHYDEDQLVLNDWYERCRLWGEIRELWYDNISEEWYSSPWSNQFERHWYDHFMLRFTRKDPIFSLKFAYRLIDCVDWTADAETFAAHLPPQEEDEFQWVWFCIGLLMLASLPIPSGRRLERIQEARSDLWTSEHVPSREAAIRGHSHTIYTLQNHGPDKRNAVIYRDLFNPFRPEGQPFANVTHLDYLNLVDDVIKEMAVRGAAIHFKFLDAIILAKTEILADRQTLARCYPGNAHKRRWASRWFFKFPGYDPGKCSVEEGQWRRVRRSFARLDLRAEYARGNM